jgi:hypothetical protein
LFAENDELARSYFRTLTRGQPENAALVTAVSVSSP